LVVTTVGDGVVVGFVEVGGVVVDEDSGAEFEDRVEVAGVVDGVVVGLEAVLCVTTIDESDAVGGSSAELGEVSSLFGRVGDVNVGNDSVLSVLEGADDEVATESVGSTVELDADVSSSGSWNGERVPSQCRLIALGPPHTCDASPVHAILHKSSEIRPARPFSRLPQKHSPAYSVPARL
jgi:hypothetical protein